MTLTAPSRWLTFVGWTILLLLNGPIILIVLAAFNNSAYLSLSLDNLTLKWFVHVLSDEAYLHAISTSIILAGIATLVSGIIGLAGAIALHRKILPGSSAITAFLMAPLIFPGIVIGVALLQFLTTIGLRGSFFALLMAHVVITVPYVTRSAMSGLIALNPQLGEAAKTMGASGITTFYLVTLPVIRPSLVAGLIFSFIISLDNVPVTIFLLSPLQMTLPVKIFTAVEQGVDPSIAAASTLIILLTAVVLLVAQRKINFSRMI
jgi:putative spermidine/putrescine transport system permease protein